MKTFTVNFKDLVNKKKNPRSSLSPEEILKNRRIKKNFLERKKIKRKAKVTRSEMKEIRLIKTYHDENCPKCNFPETVDIRIADTMELIGRECSSKDCDWAVLFIKKEQKHEKRRLRKS